MGIFWGLKMALIWYLSSFPTNLLLCQIPAFTNSCSSPPCCSKASLRSPQVGRCMLQPWHRSPLYLKQVSMEVLHVKLQAEADSIQLLLSGHCKKLCPAFASDFVNKQPSWRYSERKPKIFAVVLEVSPLLSSCSQWHLTSCSNTPLMLRWSGAKSKSVHCCQQQYFGLIDQTIRGGKGSHGLRYQTVGTLWNI